MKRLMLLWVMMLCLIPLSGLMETGEDAVFIFVVDTTAKPEEPHAAFRAYTDTEVEAVIAESLTHDWVPDNTEPVISRAAGTQTVWTVELRNKASGVTVAMMLVDSSPRLQIVYSLDRNVFGELPDLYADTRKLRLEYIDQDIPTEIEYDTYRILIEEVIRNPSLDPLVCTVISADGCDPVRSFVIDKGSRQGIEPYMAVVFNSVLIGYIEDVAPDTAVVRTVLDSRIPIAVSLESDYEPGKVSGTVRGAYRANGTRTCRMYDLPDGLTIDAGETLVTSKDSVFGCFGIPVGTITETNRYRDEIGTYVVLRPFGDGDQIRYTLVMRIPVNTDALQASYGEGERE